MSLLSNDLNNGAFAKFSPMTKRAQYSKDQGRAIRPQNLGICAQVL